MLKVYSYSLPFVTPFVTAGASYTKREGLVLVFEHNDITALGEIAPLPGFSRFSIEEILPVLKINIQVIENALKEESFNDIFSVLNQIHDIPSLKFGLDTLFHDYMSKKKNQSLTSFLFKDSYQKSIPVNATLGISETSGILEKAERLYNDGYKTFKIKVGSDFKKELEILSQLKKQFPTIKLRVDANQSWTFDESYSNLKELKHLDLEYCEEPLLIDQTNRLSELKKAIKINIAADESFRNKNDATKLTEQNAVDTFILKPMMFGSFSEIYVTKQLADSHYISMVLTTSLESIIGRTVTAILALGLGAKKYAHGLSTGSLFNHDIGTGNYVKNGTFHVPEEPGIGVDLNYKYLKRII